MLQGQPWSAPACTRVLVGSISGEYVTPRNAVNSVIPPRLTAIAIEKVSRHLVSARENGLSLVVEFRRYEIQ